MSNAEIDFCIKLQDAGQMIADAATEPQEGKKLGSYELATEKNNLPDKWAHAYNILRNSHATIQNRYFGEGYTFGYWLYGEGRIYRQKLKR